MTVQEILNNVKQFQDLGRNLAITAFNNDIFCWTASCAVFRGVRLPNNFFVVRNLSSPSSLNSSSSFRLALPHNLKYGITFL